MTRRLLFVLAAAAAAAAFAAPAGRAMPDAAGPDVACVLVSDWLDEACYTPLAAGTRLCALEAVRVGVDVFEYQLVCRRVA